MIDIIQQIDKIANQIIILSLLGLTGFAAGKTGYLPENSGTVLSKVVIKLTAPILIFTTMINYEFSSDVMKNGMWIFLFGALFVMLSFFFGSIMSNRMKLEDSTRNIYKMQSMFGNVIFLAYPLLGSIFRDEGIIYAIFFNLANDAVLWTLGIYLVNRHNTTQWKDNLKHLINANTIAFTGGLFCVLINIQHYINSSAPLKTAYTIFFDTFNPLGKTTICLSMIFIGLILSEVKIGSFSDVIKRYPIMILSFFKLLFIPLIAFFVLNALGNMIDPYVKYIVVLQLAMPCATIVPALAAQYESDYRFATEAVFVTTLLSIITLPVMVFILFR